MPEGSPEERAERGLSRRQFMSLSALGVATVATRAWTASTDRTPAATTGAAVGADGRPYTVIRTAEYFGMSGGDNEMTISFPAGWQLEIRRMDGHSAPALSDDEIRTALRNPIGTRRIADLADGKRSVVVTFDDLARPTPVGRVVPFVIEELHAGGIRDENIIFQGSFGTHSAMYQQDMVAKLGANIVEKYQCWNHDPFNQVTPVGTTSRGNEVRLNSRFVAADLKITISGVKPHGMAGYGGGAKAIIPGVAWIETTAFVHHVLNARAHPAVAYLNNECRLDMEEAARLGKLDVSLNIVMNGDRQVAGLFAGDVVQAHRAAVRVAHERYNTEPARDADVVVCNAYPQSVEAAKELHWAGQSLKDGGSAVLIQDTPAGQRKIHYLGWSEGPGLIRPRPERGLPVRQAAQVIVFNRFPCKWDENEFSEEVYFAKTWYQVIERLRRIHGDGTKVTIYPTAPLQHEPMPLRM